MLALAKIVEFLQKEHVASFTEIKEYVNLNSTQPLGS